MKKSVLILLSTTTLCFTQGYTKADRILEYAKDGKSYAGDSNRLLL